MSSVYLIKEHIIPASHIREYPRSLADEDNNEELRIAVKQYTPKDNASPQPGDVTIIAAHANGFPKELYEPLWDDLHHILAQKGRKIRNIFIADVAYQGQSGILNEKLIGNDPSWFDTARDYLLMVNHFRHEIRQPVVGIGHSMGGVNLVNLSNLHPRLFSSLVLIDPPLRREAPATTASLPAVLSATRRDRWPSRAAAEASFRKSKFYQAWDPRVFDLWIKYGLRDLPTQIHPSTGAGNSSSAEPEVTLATTKHQEVLSFLRAGPPTEQRASPYPQPGLARHLTHPDLDESAGTFYRPEVTFSFRGLATLRSSVLWIFADKSDLSAEHLCADKMANTGTGIGGSGGVKAGRVKQVRIPKAGHLVPMEQVNTIATEIATFLVPELARYDEEIAAIKKDRERVPMAKRSLLPDEYVAMLSQGVKLPSKAKI